MAERLIAHSRPLLGPREEAAAADVVRSGFVGGNGEVARRFAAAVAAQAERPAGLSFATGTAALEIALRVLGASGGTVAVPAFACLSIERAVRRAGAVPLLVDIDPVHLSFPLGALDAVADSCAAAVCVHQFGLPSPTVTDAIRAGLPVVEDYTTAMGGAIDGRPVGSSGRIGVASFSGTKMICTGAGGALVGDAVDMIAASEWMHPESPIDRELPVPNVLLPDLAAALGEVQLDRLDEFVARRHAISQAYLSVAADLGVDVKRPVPNSQGTWWRFLVALPDECDVDAVVESARARGVVFARPVTHAPSEQRGEFPVAEEMRDSLVSVPLYPALSDAEVEHVAATLRASLHEAAVVAR